jgi:hypothetical protein
VEEGKFYAGVGSQLTPLDVCATMTSIATVLRSIGWHLRSGGAKRADQAFADGAGDDKTEFLPWHRFEGRDGIVPHHTRELYDLAGTYWDMRPDMHPWYMLKDTTKLFMMRNVCQMLGEDLKTPSKAVICWTKGGAVVGGTGMALTIALHHEIPIFNLALPNTMERMEEFFNGDSQN